MSEIKIRRLEVEDLGFADEVRAIAGWNQLCPDWERLLRLEPEGCFLAEVEGQPAGTVTTTCYGRRLAWIGMVLVHPDFRRRGVGTRLLTQAIRHLRDERSIRCVKLDATPEGRPLYESLGFRGEWGLKRWWRASGSGETWEAPEDRRSISLEDESIRLDREVFGADRGKLLEALRREAIAEEADSDGSFGLARDGARAVYLGPITASDPVTGEAIARSLGAALPPDREVFWDLPDPNESAATVARALGFEPVRDLTRMWLGDENVESDPLRQWGLVDFALG